MFADGFEFGSTSEWSSTVMVFVTVTPYSDPDQIEYAGRTYCEDGSCPWGPGKHDGIDFVTGTDLVPFRAACSGTVAAVDSFVTGFGNRQVTVIIELEDMTGFGLVYAFEPMIPDIAGQQEANIEVEEGDEVVAGDLLGRLVMIPAVGSHVHWGVVSNHQQVCPRPFLTDGVESALLDLIREDVPTGEICY
jgi:murein DD-endopeptidase MepM/ murein hydrolase activator NlpD